MKVLFVNRMLFMERGGGETFDLEIARQLQRLGCHISFLSGLPLFRGPRVNQPFSRFDGPITHHVLRSPYFGWFPWDKTKGGWRLRVLDFVMFEARAASWVARNALRYDVVQVCELPFFVSRLKKRRVSVPVVMRLTAPNYYDPWNGLRKADAVIASGETVARVRAAARADCHDIPNGVDTEMFRPREKSSRKGLGIADDEYVVLYVARFQDFKNHTLLVDAFKELYRVIPRARLVLVGKGPLKRRIESQVAEAGLTSQVLFAGEQPFEALPNFYAAADVLAISSDFESFCFAALEAMATGLPIVTTDCGWVPKLLGEVIPPPEGCGAPEMKISWRTGGAVTPLRDASALAQALAALASRPPLRREMGFWNRRKAVESHSWQRSAESLRSVYFQTLEKK